MVCRRTLRRWASRVTRLGAALAAAFAAGGLLVLIGAVGTDDINHDIGIALLFFFAGGVVFALALLLAEMLRNEARSVRDG
ncbi:MAG: hypothetical protein H6977_09365 [Gammaproteobacteria bacterium]|nr:hypothetical protein [Gammaproteobacteria bacterium]MCP5200212.1 hypothetical protein [Gammaproteobacteria bacterium]